MQYVRNGMGTIFDIQKYSVNDGPGIRTLIFFKGCPLRCRWCSNPESQGISPEILFFDNICNRCGNCANKCQTRSIKIDSDIRFFDNSTCTICGACVNACPNRALRIAGKAADVDEIIAIAKQDTLFYFNSGGGVTIGGGEPTMQPEFLYSLLTELTNIGVHTAIETCGYSKWETFEKIAPLLDLILFDIKHMDGEIHKQYTGKSNELILKNLSRLLEMNVPIVIRVPMIPGFNVEADFIHDMCKFLNEFDNNQSIQHIELLPYHKLGLNKYQALNQPYLLEGTETPTASEMEVLRDIIVSCNYECKIEYI